MNSRTELVTGRYRELKATGLTGLEASRVVLREAQEWTLGRTETPRTDISKRTVGRPKKWASEAERLRAYRERSK